MKAPVRKAKAASHPLVGRAFHTVDEDGRTHWQGTFIAPIGDEHILVQLYEWFVGEPSTQHVLPIAGLAHRWPNGFHRFRIFVNMADAVDYMERVARHRDERIDREKEKAQ